MNKDNVKRELQYIYREVKNIDMLVNAQKTSHKVAIKDLCSKINNLTRVLSVVVESL